MKTQRPPFSSPPTVMDSTITATVREILIYHSLEYRVYERLLLSRSRTTAKNIVTLWLWLEQLGFHDLVATASKSPDPILVRYSREAESILDVLREDSPPPADNLRSIPLTAEQGPRPISLRFFYENRDVVVQSMSEIMDGIGTVIFDERLREVMRRNPNASELARPFSRNTAGSPAHQRTMFLMFTRDQPISRDQVLYFFTSRWGNCVERVIVEPAKHGVAPMYGRVVFRTAAYLELVLNGTQQTEFVVGGKQMWGMRPISNGCNKRRP